MLKIHNRIGLAESDTSGMDHPEYCHNIEHFRSYTKQVSYRYNSRGFRDSEWPADLSNVIWCVGDSFTVGIGQPFEETWPTLLQKKLGKRCINLGEDGCSNDTMSLRIQEVFKLYHPTNIVVMWSYFARRRKNGENIQYDKSNFGALNDLENFSENFKIVNSLPTNIINLLIPNAFLNDYKSNVERLEYILKRSNCLNDQQIKSILTFPQLDYARDGHHFDVITSNYVCDLIGKNLNPTLTNNLNTLYNTNIGRIT